MNARTAQIEKTGMIVLGIETSCDETAAAIVRDDRTVLADLVLSQVAEHAPYGGIVPEIAARSHIDHLDGLIDRAMHEAKVAFSDLDAIAVTAGPGLIGAVMVGLMTGKAIAAVHALPFIAVNHLEGHALSARLVGNAPFPYLLLLVSGGHCQLLVVKGVGAFKRLGTTLDDAAGEAFDKAAKLLGLGYPGGPAIEARAKLGDAKRFALPRPLKGRPGSDFSFSGLKTALLHTVRKIPEDALDAAVSDLAASFQAAVTDVMVDRTRNAIAEFRRRHPDGNTLVVAGGVAANKSVGTHLQNLADETGMRTVIPPAKLCTDNAAMIAWAGIERHQLGLWDALDASPRARWPLDESATASLPTPGRLGHKA